MQKNIRIAAVIIILIILGALLLAYFFTQSEITTLSSPSPITANAATKLAYYNDGNTWVHQNVVLENAKFKDGSVKTVYIDMYIKPKSSITIDLSQVLGYGNQKLPPGYKLNILEWKELLSPSTSNGSSGTLDMRMQGWSNTLTPLPSDKYLIIHMEGVLLNKLPASIQNNLISIGFDINKLTLLLSGKGAHDQILLTVDSNGKVTLRFLTIPELCHVVITDPWKNLNLSNQTTI